MELSQIMKIMGYTDEWLQIGIVDPEFLQLQYKEYERSEDKNQEHYRTAAFRGYLSRSSSISDVDIERIFRLQDDGPDVCDLRLNRIIDLIASDVLTEAQLLSLFRYSEVHEAPVKKRYIRIVLLKQLYREGLTDEIFRAAQNSDDSSVHLALLEHQDLVRPHLEWFVEHGANKSLRNRAKVMLRSRKFRE